MSRFSAVTYDPAEQTATIGAGLIWDDVYAALEPYGVNVVGGRVSGVGVAGFTLGGGILTHSDCENQAETVGRLLVVK
jgi:FAD/FMN-containing dehydrogenase